MNSKYLKSLFHYYATHLIAGTKEANIQTKQSITPIQIRNEPLAHELELACKKKNGVLTFAEFLEIDQFGEYGYHYTHKQHGLQGIHSYWGEAVANFCAEKNITSIVEFGPGAGDLGIAIVKAGKKRHSDITWHGIEINTKLNQQTITKFKNEHLESHLGQLVTSIENLTPIKNSCLMIFSFSLDNIPPYLFTNSHYEISYPNEMLGVTILNGYITEQRLTKQQLAEKNIMLENGIVTTNGISFDITSWELAYEQKACIPIPAITMLDLLMKKVPKYSYFLAIDEFIPTPYYAHQKNLALPSDLSSYARRFSDTIPMYKTIGENLYYYPTYIGSYVEALVSLGFTPLEIEQEHFLANMLAKRKVVKPRIGYCLAILAQLTNNPTFPIKAWSYKNIPGKKHLQT